MRLIIALLSLMLVLASATRQVEGSCIACWELIRVRAEFKDGSERLAYFAQSESTPTDSLPDGTKLVVLNRFPEYVGPVTHIVLYDTMYLFEGITAATTPQAVDSVLISDLQRLVYLDDFGFGAAGSVNVFDSSVIRLLHQKPCAKYTFGAEGLATGIYLSYSPDVTDSLLELLASIHGKPAQIDSRMKSLLDWIPTLAGNPDWEEALNGAIVTESFFLGTYVGELPGGYGMDPVSRYFQKINENLRLQFRCFSTVGYYTRMPDKYQFDQSIADIFESDKECQPHLSIDEKSWKLELDDMISVFCEFHECFRLSRVLGEDFSDSLEANGIILVINGYD